MNSHSAICGHCFSNLIPKDIVENTRHIYTTGTMFSCDCGKSKVWTNSIRNEDSFVKFINGQSDRYYQGFCNDKFCGYCFGHLYPLQNGYQLPNIMQSFDRWGCPKHPQNQNIAMDGFAEDRENETSNMTEWYKNNIDKVKSMVELEKTASSEEKLNIPNIKKIPEGFTIIGLPEILPDYRSAIAVALNRNMILPQHKDAIRKFLNENEAPFYNRGKPILKEEIKSNIHVVIGDGTGGNGIPGSGILTGNIKTRAVTDVFVQVYSLPASNPNSKGEYTRLLSWVPLDVVSKANI